MRKDFTNFDTIAFVFQKMQIYHYTNHLIVTLKILV